MVFFRSVAHRAPIISQFFLSARPLRATEQPWRQHLQRSTRRGYASEGHGAQQASSDLPWLVGAVGLTIPACWYTLQPSSPDDHGGHHKVQKEHEGKEENPQVSEGSPDEGKSQTNAHKQYEGTDKKEEVAEYDAPDRKGNPEGVRFKGNPGTENKPEDTRKIEPDAKGGNKKRITSEYAKNLGEGDARDESESGSAKDSPATSKLPAGDNQMSAKQAGLSNTDTRHSTNPGSDQTKSSKGEGGPDTAKLKGTVSSDRPAK